MPSRLSRAITRSVARRLAAQLQPEQARDMLAHTLPKSPPIQSPQAARQQPPPPTAEPQDKDKLRAAVSQLKPEQVQALPPELAAVLLDVCFGIKPPSQPSPS